jgi:hypothetical protein
MKKVLFILLVIVFFAIGTTCGLIGLYAYGWSIERLVKDPRFAFAVVIFIALGFTFLGLYLHDKIKKNGGY